MSKVPGPRTSLDLTDTLEEQEEAERVEQGLNENAAVMVATALPASSDGGIASEQLFGAMRNLERCRTVGGLVTSSALDRVSPPAGMGVRRKGFVMKRDWGKP